ncbi:MAG: phosphodiester glycosidase family protein [Bacteroidota bacterium]
MRLVFFVVGLLVSIGAHAQDSLFRTITFNNNRYFVADIDLKKYNIGLFNKLDVKHSQDDFASIDSVTGKKLVLIVNGGMFQKDLRPLGLYVSSGKTYMNVKRDTSGYGNFYMQPNGIFILDKNSKATVITTKEYSEKSVVTLATQSGPMLVTRGVINSHFTPGSSNLNIRNGVGINKQGHVVLVISEDQVNFYDFAKLYRDQLGCKSALYLDGVVCQYYSPELHQAPRQTIPLGVFIVVTKK